MNTFTRTAAIVIPVLAAVAGCNTMEPPEAELVQAKTQVQSADSAEGEQYAALSMKRAQEKIEQAEKAMEEKEYLKAQRLAQQAAADARLAEATAQTEKMKQALEEVNKNLDALKIELDAQS
ncbi:MAG TPA: DUF4398 domain-containing protein [Candidatus Kapabacteria bacterium]|nr:DUF4398 domain-containing protein [Candidatus Kapabacteria bacterium]